ncbi:glycoside hydrolase family 65, partial [bacterium]|nr:glycoside hydrolase family 65 [bacterium]
HGMPVEMHELDEIHQTLNLWDGILSSRFSVDGIKVQVETCCHPETDQIAVRIHSDMIRDAGLGIIFNFPYGSLSWGKESGDWQSPEKHRTIVLEKGNHSVVLERRLDSSRYYVTIQWEGQARFDLPEKNRLRLETAGSDDFNFICHFSPEKPVQDLPGINETFEASADHWNRFWKSGGAIDLSKSKDPRARELERRIVLSQYLMAVQCAGSMPPQETGLTCNSWFGKFHLEMHWWHAVHFALWGRPELLEKSFDWYGAILPAARKKAARQGYEGVRWPKMTDPDGRESPSNVGVFLVWQQPHPIYYAELLYRNKEDRTLLDRYQKIVFETAGFMASYTVWDESRKRYVLGPPLIPAQELYKPETTINPAFELSYWAFGLRTAQHWRERLGLSRNEKWDHILAHMSEIPENDGFYQNTETAMNTFKDAFHRNDHPTLLGAYGMLPNADIDVEIMRSTLKEVLNSWNWDRTWGWDYPLIAMTAARVGEPEMAVDALLMDVQRNTYLTNGHNYQDRRLTLYLPGNGGLLTAAAMMAAGWDGAPEGHAPGFPADGGWHVEWEGLYPMP